MSPPGCLPRCRCATAARCSLASLAPLTIPAPPPAVAYLVLTVPPGEFILTDRLFIQRSYLVLCGAGSGLTTLRISKTLLDLLGPNPDDPHGFYVNNRARKAGGGLGRAVRGRGAAAHGPGCPPHSRLRCAAVERLGTTAALLRTCPCLRHCAPVPAEAYITMRGTSELGRTLAKVTGSAAKGTRLLTLDSTANVAVGQMIQLQFKDVGGAFNDYM